MNIIPIPRQDGAEDATLRMGKRAMSESVRLSTGRTVANGTKERFRGGAGNRRRVVRGLRQGKRLRLLLSIGRC
jgi:hypothetical protein